MSIINQIETITKSPDLIFDISINGIFMKLLGFFKKFESVFLVSIVLLFIYKKFGLADKNIQSERIENSSENEVLELYYLEGMKLFNQGEYAKNLKPNKDREGL